MNDAVASRRYLWRLFPAMAVVLVASLGLSWLDENSDAPSSVLIAAAFVPIIALLVPFWAMWRFLMEIDEFLRLVHVKALLVGTATILVIATGWGYLEAFAGVPALAVFWLNPIFWVGYSVAAVVLSLREGFPV